MISPPARSAVDRLVPAVTIVALACIALFLPAPILTYDEAKYVAVGRSLLNGEGPLTDLGQLFIVHPPLYPLVLAAPTKLGLDPVAWGHVLNAGALALMLFAAWRLALPFGRLQAALVVLAVGAWTYQLDLARTARLDVPQAALILSYLLVTTRACRTGLLRDAAPGAALFVAAFLVKESSLIFLVAPFLAALATGSPVRSVLRVGGITMLSFVVLAGWWFAWYAQRTGRLFALGLPASAMPLLAVVAVAIGAGCLLLGARTGGRIGSLVTRLERVVESRRRRLMIAAAVAAGWTVLFLLAFARHPLLAGIPLIDGRQLAKFMVTWRGALELPAAIGLGIVPALVALQRDDRTAPTLLMLVAGLAWVLFATDLGEPPRNDLAAIVLAVVCGIGGWSAVAATWGRGRAAPAVRAILGTLAAAVVLAYLVEVGLAPSFLRRTIVLVVAAASVGLAAAIIPFAVDRLRHAGQPAPARSSLRRATQIALAGACAFVVVTQAAHAGMLNSAATRSSASRVPLAVADWLRANVPDGSRVALGSALQQQVAAGLAGRYRVCPFPATIAEASAAAPLGLVRPKGAEPIVDRWAARDRHGLRRRARRDAGDPVLRVARRAGGRRARGSAPDRAGARIGDADDRRAGPARSGSRSRPRRQGHGDRGASVYRFAARRAANRSSVPDQPASNARPGSSRSMTSGAWSDGMGLPLRASRSISSATMRPATGGVGSR